LKLALELKGSKGQIQVTSVEARVIMGKEGQTMEKSTLQIEKKAEVLRLGKYFEIVSPSSGENWEINKTATIYWKFRGVGGNLALELFRNRHKVALISRNIPVNKGFYHWKVSGDDIFPGLGYHVRLTTLSDKKSHISDTFSIMEEFGARTLKKYTLAPRTLKLKEVETAKPISLKILTPQYQDQWNVLYSFPRQTVPVVYPDQPSPVSFSARTKSMNLEAGQYRLEISIDPDNKAGEEEPFRGNNRVAVEFEVK